MKTFYSWHHTAFGKACRWLGSIQLAIPVLTLVVLALGWGTYLESTRDAKIARATVYGSWWFMGLMILVCVSLIFAAVVRIPWKRKQVGFLIVHASLVTLIVAGFMSLYGRVEGHIGLQEGNSSSQIEMDDEQVELVEHDGGGFHVLGAIPVPVTPGSYTVGGYPIDVTEIWPNVREEFDVTNDGPEPYRAVRIAFGPVIESAIWIGDEAKGAAPVIAGIKVRVLAAGGEWQPPAPPAAGAQPVGKFVFVVGDKRIALGAEGQEPLPGWKVSKVAAFTHATVGPDGLVEDTSKPHNPAVEVTLTDGKGSIERHTAFEQFADMVLVKAVQGADKSGVKLVKNQVEGADGASETLVVYGQPPAMKLGYIGRDGAVKLLEGDGKYPWAVDLGSRKLTIISQLTNATEHSRFVKAAAAKDSRPAIVVKTGDTTAPLAWKAMLPINLPGRVAVLRFGPKTVTLPFAIKLEKFRKTDYPGTDMAMAYESDVSFTPPGAGEQRATISMNEPLVESGWKVYQSGFVGEDVSVFSVMHDPGLVLTYLSCTTLCIGIMITFYGRGLSWGHPGIPVPFSSKELPDGSARIHDDSVDVPPSDGPRAAAAAKAMAGTAR